MRLPSSKQRVLVNGRTGSGKTVAAVWLLLMSNFLSAPWYVLNQKNTAIIDAIPGAKHVGINERPTKPGIYIFHHRPDTDDDALEDLLWFVWGRGHIGLYMDEGYMINPRSPALNALYTQGREKHIPMITLSQRPVKISRFAVSESDYFMLFHMQNKKDRDLVGEYVPVDLETLMGAEAGTVRQLPDFHSIWYDVSKNSVEILRPVPPEEDILQQFEDRFSLSKNKNRLL